jgi:hypothetical protein
MGPRAYILYYPAMILALIYCLNNLQIRRLSSRVALALAFAFVCYFLLYSLLINYPGGSDFEIFRNAGLRLREGGNPYEDVAMVSPPTSLPLFAVFSLADFDTSLAIWTSVNLVLSIFLIPMAWSCLFGRIQRFNTKTLAEEIAPLTSFFVLSFPILWGVGLGQLAIFETFLLITAFLLRDRGQQLGAGISLALATLKPQTVIPCLLVFLRKDHIKTWASLCFSLAALLVAMRSIPHFFEALQDEMKNVAALAAPGKANDYSFEAPYYHTVIGLNYLFYCLGLRDRMLIQILNVGATLAMGATLLLAITQKRWQFEVLLSMICIYALLFFYHRFHDAAILAIPLTYSYGMALRSTGRQRTAHFLTLVALLPVFVVHPKAVALFVNAIPDSMPLMRRLGEACLLPYATWSALIALVFMWLGFRRRSRMGSVTASPMFSRGDHDTPIGDQGPPRGS